MLELKVERQEVSKDKLAHTVLDSDCPNYVNEDVVATEGGRPVFIRKQLKSDLTPLWTALDAIKYDKNIRTKGLKTNSRIFGFNPRNTIRKDFCSATSMSYQHKVENAIVCEYGKLVSEIYKEIVTTTYEDHFRQVTKMVLPEWIIPGTPFTSGIINKNNNLKYHYDQGNFKGVYSCMIVLKRDVTGGDLILPEYGIKVGLPSGSIFLFDGQNIMHGVTPITTNSAESVRYSIVYYSLQQMCKCLKFDDELARIRKRKTEREQRRARGEVHESLVSNTK